MGGPVDAGPPGPRRTFDAKSSRPRPLWAPTPTLSALPRVTLPHPPVLSLVLLAALVACNPGPAPPPPTASAPSAADVPDPIYEAYDVFVVAGQSNAKGRGTAEEAPEVPAGAAYEATPQGEIRALADPVGGANTGSAWPAFANAYTAATGRGVVIIGMAAGGYASGLIRDLTGSYDMAFVHGIVWNVVNLAIMTAVLLSSRSRPLATA